MSSQLLEQIAHEAGELAQTKERINLLVRQAHKANVPVTDLALTLGVSRTTIYAMLDHADRWATSGSTLRAPHNEDGED